MPSAPVAAPPPAPVSAAATAPSTPTATPALPAPKKKLEELKQIGGGFSLIDKVKVQKVTEKEKKEDNDWGDEKGALEIRCSGRREMGKCGKNTLTP